MSIGSGNTIAALILIAYFMRHDPPHQKWRPRAVVGLLAALAAM
jgi:hypothetical protein